MNTKIMIIDAHPVYAPKVAGFLESFTFKDIIMVDQGAKAIEAVVQHRPHIIILSATLPDTNSVDLLKEIKSCLSSTSVIVQTGLLTNQKTVEQFKSAGASHVFARREKDWSMFENALKDIMSIQEIIR